MHEFIDGTRIQAAQVNENFEEQGERIDREAALSRQFSIDRENTNGLMLSLFGGVFDGEIVPGLIFALEANVTNYIELDPSAPAVMSNEVGFTPGNIKLWALETDDLIITNLDDPEADRRSWCSNGEVEWADVQNKPVTFAPSAHTHGVADITGLQTALDTKADDTDLALKADLVGGVVPSAQLPSYVDDVLEYANFASLPGAGTTGKIYVTLDTNKTYRWSGSAYVEVSSANTDIAGQTESTSPLTTWLGIFYDGSGNKKATIANIFTLFLSAARNYLASYIEFPAQAAPSNPAAGFVRLYIKASGVLAFRNSAGTETEVGAGGGSGDMLAADYDPNGDGVIGVAEGGTGASSAAAAFNALKQAATTSATGVVRLATDGEAIAGVVVQGNDSRLNGNGASAPANLGTTSTFTPVLATSDYFYGTTNANSTLANPTGTPVNGQALIIEITKGGGTHTLTLDSNYEASGMMDLTQFTAATNGALVTLFFLYSPTRSKFVGHGLTVD